MIFVRLWVRLLILFLCFVYGNVFCCLFVVSLWVVVVNLCSGVSWNWRMILLNNIIYRRIVVVVVNIWVFSWFVVNVRLLIYLIFMVVVFRMVLDVLMIGIR